MASGEDLLSKADCLLLLETISACVGCSDTTQAERIAGNVKDLIGFDHAVYGLAKLNSYGGISDYDTLNFSYPDDWLEAYRFNNFHLVDPIAQENFRHYGLQYWGDTYQRHEVDKSFVSTATDFRLVEGYALGVVNGSRTEGCILSLAGSIKKDPRHELILNHLAPHLHQAFRQALCTDKKSRVSSTLSSREKEVLNWIKKGKSSWDISNILAISERTVKFHVDNVMRKLDAVSRIHAVAVALSVGLIDID